MQAEKYVNIDGKFYKLNDLEKEHQDEILEEITNRVLRNIGKIVVDKPKPRIKRKITAQAYMFIDGKFMIAD